MSTVERIKKVTSIKKSRLVRGVSSVWLILTVVFIQWMMVNPVFASVLSNSILCAKAASEANYNTEFLKNFVGLKQGDTGWLFRGIDLKTIFGSNAAGYRNLERLNKLLRGRGIKLIMVPTPTRAIIHPEKLAAIDYNVKHARTSYKNYIKALNRLGIVTPKLYRLFESFHSKPLFFARDHHWTTAGSRMIAKLTAKPLTASKKYQRIEKINYTSTRIGSQKNNGSLAKAAKLLCGTTYEAETVEHYLTEPTAPQDLFADTPAPKVSLVGTSNSKGRLNFNFAGFLRQYSQVDILNQAESGGGPFSALYQYLASDSFNQNPPLFLIWEVPGYYRLNNHKDFNKLFALLGEPL
jgi:alginate biosynthesis protein AlgX